jgi:hypothetical protein
MANTQLGRPPLAGVQQIGVDRNTYTLAGSWPTPTRTNSYGGGPAMPALEPKPEAPKTAGQMVWPNLK